MSETHLLFQVDHNAGENIEILSFLWVCELWNLKFVWVHSWDMSFVGCLRSKIYKRIRFLWCSLVSKVFLTFNWLFGSLWNFNWHKKFSLNFIYCRVGCCESQIMYFLLPVRNWFLLDIHIRFSFRNPIDRIFSAFLVLIESDILLFLDLLLRTQRHQMRYHFLKLIFQIKGQIFFRNVSRRHAWKLEKQLIYVGYIYVLSLVAWRII